MADSVGFAGAQLNVSPGLKAYSALKFYFPLFQLSVKADCNAWVWDEKTHTHSHETHILSMTHLLSVHLALFFPHFVL